MTSNFLDNRRKQELEKLLKKLGLSDLASVNWSLLNLALIHPSFPQKNNYQQLEFVGDAVIRLVAAQVLLETYPDAPVGEFAALRSGMVSDRTLAEFADIYGLERYLLTSPREARDQLGRISRLADAFEAILGALYLSTETMELIRCWLDNLLKDKAAEIYRDPARQNYKDALQEWTQAHYKALPEYRVKENPEYEDIETRFVAEVWFQGKKLGCATGRTKKAAEQAAAKTAMLEQELI